jgi:transcriptional regulator with XRE-family HTH domain
MDNQKIGAFITEQRKAKKLTQQELADKIAVTVQAVSKWECGKGLPDISLMKPLCDTLDISINELLNGEKIAEKDIATKAEQQIVKQLTEQEKLLKKQKTMRAVASLFLTIGLVLMLAFIQSERVWVFWFAVGYVVFGLVLCLILIRTDRKTEKTQKPETKE